MSKLDRARKEIQRLKEQIRHHVFCYYVLNQPEIADSEYDKLLKDLQQWEERFPQLVDPESPSQRVSGQPLKEFKSVKHRLAMLSLDNAYSFEEIEQWAQRVRKGLGRKEKIEFLTELKFDGTSASFTYENGQFILGASRGDGQTGDDITANLKTMRSLPLKLIPSSTHPLPQTLEVRGEVYVERGNFDRLN